MKRWIRFGVIGASALVSGACASGEGDALFTTWGEAYIEREIPADPSGEAGFVDGWTVRYQKFLVVFHGIEVADSRGRVAASQQGSLLVDNVRPGIKELVSFANLDAQRWDRVSYQIKPPDGDTARVAASADDLAFMQEHGYSMYVEGTATRPGDDGELARKTFRWGLGTATQYSLCKQPQTGGPLIEGIVITNGGEDVSELTTHGDHFFYDRLRASDDPARPTSLRFQPMAEADADGDGEVTLAELAQTPIDVRLYDPSGLPASTLGAFVTALSRTVGHFRGEGECAVGAL